MDSLNYWRKREEEALQHYISDEKQFDKEINRIYSDMLDGIQGEISAFYGKYAKSEGITIAEAKKRVSALDIAAYERKAKRYVRAAAKDRAANGGKTDRSGYYFSQRANEEMKLYNLTMKVNRLEMLKANIGLEMIKGHAELETFMGDILQGRTMEELERQAGILGKTVKNNAQTARSIVNASYKNATFSDRIWMYQDAMKADLGKLLTQGLIQGKNPRVLARDIERYVVGNKRQPYDKKGAKYYAERLMRTELARVQTEAQKQSFERNGFEQYKFIANSGCCEICKSLDGKPFDVKDMMPGENASPIHPHCRCSAVAISNHHKELEEWRNFIDSGGTNAQWEKMQAQRKGLAAKIGGNGIPKHDKPIFLGKVDYNNRKAVQKVLTNFEKTAINETVETACVVTRNGDIYKCFGTENRVFPDFDLGEELKGGTVSHNHPIKETMFSFSDEDLASFMDYELDVLRGCDGLYTYEFTRNSKDIDDFADMDIENVTEENYQHFSMIRKAQRSGIGYRRWKNE